MPEDERLWLVDGHDEPIGSILKSAAHGDPTKLHREIGVLLFDEADRTLLQRRSHTKRMHPGEWAVACAGHVPYGESYEAAAHMELREELGFDTKLIAYDKRIIDDPEERRFMQFFLGKYEDQPLTLQESEVAEVSFYSPEQFEELVRSDDIITDQTPDLTRQLWNGQLDGLKAQL